jgi:succinate dehydrogenase / fumarate reductase cytochrome b subunit
VSTAIATNTGVSLLGGRNHFLLRRLHSLTGLAFGGYLLIHLIVNATIAQFASGHDMYQVQVGKIHSLPMLWALEWGLIYLPITFHAVYGTWMIFTCQPNVTSYPYAKNWFYLVQRISAVIIVLFIVFHVLALKYGLMGATLEFDPTAASSTIHRHMTAGWWVAWLVYPIGIIASCFHLANGIWTAGITWGLTVSAGAQRRFGAACAGLFALTIILGFTALFASLDPDMAGRTDATAHAQEPHTP